MADVTLITPTRDRPEAFKLLERWMNRQTFRGEIQWIVVDDGDTPVSVRAGQEYVRRQAGGEELSTCENYRAALDRVRSDKVLFIEDDDWYCPSYVSLMVDWLEEADLVGEAGGRYYHLHGPRWIHLQKGFRHASMHGTGIRTERLDSVEKVLEQDVYYVDAFLWRKGPTKQKLVYDYRLPLTVSIKGMPGRRGPTWDLDLRYQMDRNLSKLMEWTGDASVVEAYKPYTSEMSEEETL